MGLHYLYLTERDLEKFGQKLIEAFPNVRFVDQDVCSVPKWRAVAAKRAREYSQDLDTRRPHGPDRGEAVHFFRRLPFYNTVIEAWNVSPRWRPRWLRRPGRRSSYLANAPSALLRTYVSVDVVSSDEAFPEHLKEWRLTATFLDGRWRPGDDAGRLFVQRAFRILESICTKEFVTLDKATLEPVVHQRGGLVHNRAGHDATVWANRGPRRYCGAYLRPIWIEKRARVTRKATDTRVKN